MPDFDVVVRGGTVIDGTGAAPFEADVAIKDGRIAQVGKVAGSGAEEIDARGLLVTPGFVDVHTHYDGQVTWESRLIPSSAHGVTTAVIGNCGVGFAPCKPDQHELLIQLMEGVEDIPNPVLSAGLPWTWESFPEYLDLLASRQYDIDFGCYLPHAPLRVFVMGQRGVDREPATEADLAEMSRLAGEAMRAGALGIATSRTLFHRSSDGSNIATLGATEEELTTLALVLKQEGKGIFQAVGDFSQPAEFFGLLRRLAEKSGRPLTFSLGTSNNGPSMWRDILGWVRQANEDGLTIKAQVMPRAIGMILGHELTMNPFYTTDTYRKLSALPLDQRIAELRKPEVKARILAEEADPNPTIFLGRMVRQYGTMFLLGDPPDYEQPAENSIAARAARAGITPDELAYDLMLEDDGRARLYLAMANYPGSGLEEVGLMLRHPDTVPGLGDGGAHCGTICDGSYSTYLLTHWTRDRTRGARLDLVDVIKGLSHDTARLVGLDDRGVVAAGYRADLNIIDHARVRLHAPEVVRDLPAQGRRLIQRAEGFRATLVNGVPVYRDGEPTGALPGRLVRGPQKVA